MLVEACCIDVLVTCACVLHTCACLILFTITCACTACSCTILYNMHTQASLDEPTQTVVIHHASPNKLQCQALLLADKVCIEHCPMQLS